MPVLASLRQILQPSMLLNGVRVVALIWNCGRHSLEPEALAQLTFKQYLEREGYSSDFIDNVAIPMAALVCTCSYDAVANYPAQVLCDYFARSFMRWGGVQRATLGARDVVTRLSQNCDVRLSTAVHSVSRAADGSGRLVVRTKHGDDVFDHIILATPAHIAAKILEQGDAGAEFVDTLKTFRAEQTVTVWCAFFISLFRDIPIMLNLTIVKTLI